MSDSRFSKYCKALLKLLYHGRKSRVHVGFFFLRQSGNILRILVIIITWLRIPTSLDLLCKTGTVKQESLRMHLALAHYLCNIVCKKYAYGALLHLWGFCERQKTLLRHMTIYSAKLKAEKDQMILKSWYYVCDITLQKTAKDLENSLQDYSK